jgi:hypothetical protein
MLDPCNPPQINNARIYQPLASDRHIRVLLLEPATSSEDPIKCTLQEVWLDQPGGPSPPYRALSYAWGAREGTVPITCNGQRLLVTQNCHDALRHLRLPSSVEVFWVDAICIRQNSVIEKNHQVAIMGHVFKYAREVVVWLGNGYDDTKALFKYLSLQAPLSRLATRERVHPTMSAVIDEESLHLHLVGLSHSSSGKFPM